MADSDKKGGFKQERMFGRAAKPIANTLNGLAEMDFSDYGDHANFLLIRDTFSRFPAITFLDTKRKGEQTAEMAEESVISGRIYFVWAPGIMMVGKDSGFAGRAFQIFAPRVI